MFIVWLVLLWCLCCLSIILTRRKYHVYEPQTASLDMRGGGFKGGAISEFRYHEKRLYSSNVIEIVVYEIAELRLFV